MSQTLPGMSYGINGTITYNGWSFKGPRVSSFVELIPQSDEADRTVIYNVYRIHVSAIVTNDSSGLDAGYDATVSGSQSALNILTIQAALSKQGGSLVYDPGWGAAGWALITVNTNSSDRDVSWGPRTTRLEFHPIGQTLAYQVDWTVEFAMLQCSAATPTGVLGQLRSMNYRVSYKLDYRGLTTRRIDGHLSIALNRAAAGSTVMTTTADDFRNRLTPQVPFNFRRNHQEYLLSADKSRLDFSFDDEELPSENGFPVGIASMSATHSISSRFPRYTQINATISGSVDVLKTFPMSYGMGRILDLLRDRIGKVRSTTPILITELNITESIFERRIDFSLSYRSTVGNLNRMVADSGIFTPVPFDMAAWANTMASVAWDQRGTAQLHTLPSSDVIVDGCSQVSPGTNFDTGQYTYAFGVGDSLRNVRPPKQQSYLDYRSKFKTSSKRRVETLRPMSSSGSSNGLGSVQTASSDGSYVSGMDLDFNQSPTTQITDQKVYVEFFGHGERMGYPVEIPAAVAVLNQNSSFTLADSQIANEQYGSTDGVELFAGAWYMQFECTMPPSQLASYLAALPGLTQVTSDDTGAAKVYG